MRIRLAVLALALLAALPIAAAAQDAAAVAPESYKKLLDNERVRVFEVTFKKGASVAMHSHPDHVVYVLAGGTLEFTLADGSKHSKEAKSGQTFFVPAEAHSLKNVGKSVVKLVSTELKEAAPSGTLSSAERSALLDLLSRGERELEELVASTPDELWATKPAPDRWSVAEVVEHLGAAEPFLFGLLQQTLAAPVDPDWAQVEGALAADKFVGMLQDRSQKFQAPEPIQPKGGLTRAEALARFAGARAVTAEFVRRTGDPIQKHVAALPFGKMTGHQLLTMIAGHNLRHNAQIREALEVLRKQ